MNSAKARAADVASQIIEQITAGWYPPGSQLPTELELCEATGVSRATLREAMKSLQQLGVTSIEQGRGSFVLSADNWSPFDPAVLAARVGQASGSSQQWSAQLAEARRVVEVEVAGLAASRRTEHDLTVLRDALTAMRAASVVRDVAGFATADIAFHQAVMNAAGNEFIRALFDPVARLIHISRVDSSGPAARQTRAIRMHRTILAAIAERDSAAAAAAMREHLDETLAWTVRSSQRTDRRTAATADRPANRTAT